MRLIGKLLNNCLYGLDHKLLGIVLPPDRTSRWTNRDSLPRTLATLREATVTVGSRFLPPS